MNLNKRLLEIPVNVSDLLQHRPRCHNRQPAPDGLWVANGVCPRTLRPRLRWSPRWFVDRCATWDTRTDTNETPYPVTHGWNCTDCRWLPKEAKK